LGGGAFYPASAPTMPAEFWEELALENPIASDRITAQDAADWFYLKVWPRFKSYDYAPAQHRQMILRWWSRIDGQEILDARHLRAVKEGRAKAQRHRPRPGSREMPQEPRNVGEWQKQGRLRLIGGGG